MRIWKTTVLALAAAAVSPVLCAQSGAGPDETRETNIKAYIELLRKDVKKDKMAFLTEIMDFTPEEASKFWPVYGAYDKELSQVGNEKVALYRMYVDNLESLTDAQVTQIVTGLQDAETKTIGIRKKYFQQVSQALGAKTAARFIQVERQLSLLLDLQVCASLPIVD